jgi:hypothetical protein
MHDPLVSVTWGRDIDLRSDVSIADETSSFTNSSFAAAGGPSPSGKSWVGKNTDAIAGIALDIGKTAQPLTLWAIKLAGLFLSLSLQKQSGVLLILRSMQACCSSTKWTLMNKSTLEMKSLA